MARWTNRGRWPIAVALLAALIAGIAPVSAADSALNLAHKALKAGKPELALRALNAALAGGALKGGDIAKAYYVRGLANAKAGNQAAAISDLNNALYLKGLSDTERKDAEAAKAAAYRTAGVSGAPAMAEAKPMASKPAVKVAEAPVPAAAAVEPAASAEPLPWKGQTQPAPKQVVAVDAPQPEPVAPAPAPAAVQQTSSDNPFSSMLGGLFGSDQPAPAAPVSQPIPDATKSVTVVQAETTSTTLPAPAWHWSAIPPAAPVTSQWRPIPPASILIWQRQAPMRSLPRTECPSPVQVILSPELLPGSR